MINVLDKWILRRLRICILSLTNNPGNVMDRISNDASFYARFTYRFFCSPHTWNNDTSLVEFGESKWNWRSKVWKISTAISLVVTLTQILMEFRYTFLLHENPTTIILFRRLQILASFLLLIFQLNTVWKVKEYKEFINQLFQLFRMIEQDRILSTATLNRIYWVTSTLMTIGFLLLLTSPFLFVILIFYPEVDPNSFHKLIPGLFARTSVAGRREHWNPLVAFAVVLLEFTVLSQQCCHGLNYTSFVPYAAIGVIPLLQEMKTIIGRSQDHVGSPLLDLDYFIKLYQGVYLLCNRLNDWISSVAIPGVLSIGMAIIVFINYTLLTTTTNGFEKLALVAFSLGYVLFIGVCMHVASFVSFRSKETLTEMAARTVVLESEYDSRRLKGCIDCRSYFGSMFYFSPTTILELGHIVVDKTIEAVLTFP